MSVSNLQNEIMLKSVALFVQVQHSPKVDPSFGMCATVAFLAAKIETQFDTCKN